MVDAVVINIWQVTLGDKGASCEGRITHGCEGCVKVGLSTFTRGALVLSYVHPLVQGAQGDPIGE